MPGGPTFDLQSHSTCSDGALRPAEVVRMAAQAGVKLLALTDHDTVAGVPEALAAARIKNIHLTPAVELSSVHADAEDLHILGYDIDVADSTLTDALADFRADRVRRIAEMAERLGLRLPEHPSPGRPHLAGQLQRRHPELTRDELFAAYLTPGAPTYVRRSRPTVAQAIDIAVTKVSNPALMPLMVCSVSSWTTLLKPALPGTSMSTPGTMNTSGERRRYDPARPPATPTASVATNTEASRPKAATPKPPWSHSCRPKESTPAMRSSAPRPISAPRS